MADKLFFGGIPTEPDVRALREAYPEKDMKTGTLIPYADVAKLIHCDKDSSRFHTVTSRWRRMVEREADRIVIGTEANVGFKVLDNSQKLDLGHSKLTSAVRSTRRAFILTSRVEIKALTEEERERLTNLQRRSAAVLGAAQIKATAQLPSLGD